MPAAPSGFPPLLIPPHSVGKPFTNSPPSSIVTIRLQDCLGKFCENCVWKSAASHLKVCNICPNFSPPAKDDLKLSYNLTISYNRSSSSSGGSSCCPQWPDRCCLCCSKRAASVLAGLYCVLANLALLLPCVYALVRPDFWTKGKAADKSSVTIS